MGWRGPMTHRQFLLWIAWLREEWNTPNRSDWYAMRVAKEIVGFRQAFGGGDSPSINDMKIPFESPESEQNKKDEEELLKNRIAASKSRWLGVMKKAKKKPT